jgi:hypothetical protein
LIWTVIIIVRMAPHLVRNTECHHHDALYDRVGTGLGQMVGTPPGTVSVEGGCNQDEEDHVVEDTAVVAAVSPPVPMILVVPGR